MAVAAADAASAEWDESGDLGVKVSGGVEAYRGARGVGGEWTVEIWGERVHVLVY